MTVTLIPAAKRHVGPIATILGGWRKEADWLPSHFDAKQLRAHARLLLDRTEVTMAGFRGRAVGFIALHGGTIHSLYLASEARRKGIGGRLLDHAKTGHHFLDLWTHQANTEARRFYVRQGFYENRMTNGEGNDENLPDVHMVWARGAP